MSLAHLEILEKTLRPAEVVSRLGKSGPPEAAGEQLYVPCPRCAQRALILPTGIVCSSKDCTFRAGSSLDYLAAQEGKISIAVDLLLTSFQDELRQFQGYEPEQLRRDITQAALHKRQLFDFFLKQQMLDSETKIKKAQAESWLRRSSIVPDSVRSSVFAVDAADVAEFQRICNNLGVEVSLPNEASILFPFMGDHHSVAEVIVLSHLRQFTRVTCLPFQFSFFGLNEGNPNGDSTICGNHMDAAAMNTFYKKFEPTKVCYSLLYNARASRVGHVPSAPCILHKSDEPVSPYAALYKECPSLKSRPYDAAEQFASMTWSKYLVAYVMDQFREHRKLTASIKLFVDTSRLGMVEQTHIYNALRADGMFEQAEQLEEYLRSGPVMRVDNIALYETPTGYYISRKDAYRTQVANFSVELENNITFRDSPDIFHSGKVMFQGKSYPITLNAKHLDNPRDFETAVRSAEARCPGRGSQMPTVTDRAAMKYVVAHLRATIAKLDRKAGIARLGWHAKKTAFYGPSWLVDMDGCKNLSHEFHPDVDILQYFTSAFTEIPLVGTLPPGLCELIAQATAMVARSYVGAPIRPIRISNKPSSRSNLLALFEGLGQKSIVQLNSNSRMSSSEVGHIEGLPFVAQGYSHGQLENSKLAAFILTEEGSAIYGDVAPEVLRIGAAVLRQAIIKTALWLLDTEGKKFKQAHSISNEVELSREGQELLRNVCGFANWPEAPVRYQVLEQVLRSIPANRISEYFSHYLVGQRLYLDTRLLPNIDLVTLELEMRKISSAFARHGHYFSVDALAGSEILNNFYQENAYPTPIPEPPLSDGLPGEKIV